MKPLLHNYWQRLPPGWRVPVAFIKWNAKGRVAELHRKCSQYSRCYPWKRNKFDVVNLKSCLCAGFLLQGAGRGDLFCSVKENFFQIPLSQSAKNRRKSATDSGYVYGTQWFWCRKQKLLSYLEFQLVAGRHLKACDILTLACDKVRLGRVWRQNHHLKLTMRCAETKVFMLKRHLGKLLVHKYSKIKIQE